MKKKSIKKNFIYNLILTSANMLFPLVTAPYLSYILGAQNIGKVNFATSLINWFILIAAFGIPRYGIREISKNRDNKKQMSSVFWNLISIQTIISLISIIIYMLVIFNIPRFEMDIEIYLMMIVMLVLNIFSIDWFYQGIEEYGYITVRNIALKVISIILIFIMVQNKDDYLIYAGINIFGMCFNNILNYINAGKYIDKKVYEFKLVYYMKELKIYFVTTLVIALYTQLDQTFVGYSSPENLAFYLRSKMVLGVGMSITNSIVTVLIPRTAYLKQHDYELYKSVISKSINYIYIIGLPCIVGIFLLSKEVMILLGGAEFIPASYSLQIISILVVINSIGGWQVNQILIPYKQEKIAFKIQTIGAILSVVLNILLVPKLSYIGAAISWVITEIFLVIVETIAINKKCEDLQIRYITNSSVKYFISVMIMALPIILFKYNFENYIIVIALSLIVSPILYFTINIILKEEISIEIVNQIKYRFINNTIDENAC